MAAGYDGSIRIDTSIETKNFSAGVKRIGTALQAGMKAAKGAVMGTVATVGLLAAGLAVAAGAVIGLAIAAVSMGKKIFDALSNSISKTSAYYSTVTQLQGAFNGLKSAFLGAFGTLLNAALPAILTIVNWLTRLINLAAQFIAALTGQSTYMKYVEGSAEATAKATGAAAKNTERQGEAAKGALAAFDEINVLQQHEEPETGGGGGGAGGGPMQFEEAPISEAISRLAEKFKTAWENIKTWAINAWTNIQAVWSAVSTWFMENVWGPVSTWAAEAWNNIKLWAQEAWAQIQADIAWLQENVFTPIGERIAWLAEVFRTCAAQIYSGFIMPIVNWFKAILWPGIQQIIQIIVHMVSGFVATVQETFRIGFEVVRSVAMNIWTALVGIVNGIITTIGGIVQFLTGVFTADWKLAWEGIKNIFKGVWEAVSSIVKGVVNSIIDYINGMIRAIVFGINTMISKINAVRVSIPEMKVLGQVVFPGFSMSLNIPSVGDPPQIPRLAQGAVIPPNAEFLAMLGDQRHGKNLEMPAGLLDEMLDSKFEQYQNRQEVTINFAGSLGALVQQLKPYIDRENRRVGKSLIRGGV